MPNHRVEAIANEFIDLAKANGRSLSNMQLQKLPYIAHGWGLVINGEPLINSAPCAWQYGPVYPSLYKKLRKYGSGFVDSHIHEEDANDFTAERGAVIREPLTEDERRLINAVWNSYGTHSAFYLSSLTHQPRSPWTIVREKWGEAPIPDDIIKQHFSDLARERRAQRAN